MTGTFLLTDGLQRGHFLCLMVFSVWVRDRIWELTHTQTTDMILGVV